MTKKDLKIEELTTTIVTLEEENVYLVDLLNTARLTINYIQTKQDLDKTVKLNPTDVLDSIAIKSMIDIDKSGEVFDLGGVALLTELRGDWSKVSADKAKDNS